MLIILYSWMVIIFTVDHELSQNDATLSLVDELEFARMNGFLSAERSDVSHECADPKP